MVLRGIASQFARASSGLWQGFAEAIDPPQRQPEPTTKAEPVGPDPVPEGAMLVPLDTWARILEQIGNIHEAGQQLADARERAARAETENNFLRDQLADLKARQRPTPGVTTKPPTAESTDPGPDDTPSSTARTVRRARERASKWLSP